MNNFLVTGASGQLGKCLKYNSTEVQKVNLFFPNKKEVDVTKKKTIDDFCKKNSINGIINCAAYTNVEKAELDVNLAYKTNVLGVKNCLDLTEKNGLKLIHISTDYVFDGSKTEDYKENHIKKPLGIYGLSKSEGEDLVIKSNSSSIVIRTSWLFSPFGNNFVKTILNMALKKNLIEVVSDQIGKPTYGIDLAKTIINIILEFNSCKNKVYHFANSGKTSWFYFAEKIINKNNLKLIVNPIKSSEYKSNIKRPKNSVLSTILIEKTLNLQIRPWELALKECLYLIDNE